MRSLRPVSFAPSRPVRGHPRPAAHGQNRPGFALGLALVFVLAIGALATSAIVLTSNAAMMAKAVDRQRELKYAAEDALAQGKSKLNFDPAALPDSGQTQMISNALVYAADNTPLPNVKVNVWVGPTGSTTGQYGRFASVVAQAVDNRNTGFVRRLELTQESFAKFAYWSDNETTPGGSTIYFNNGDQLWGPVWSNDIIHIGSGGASFHDLVATSKTISGISYGTFSKGYQQNQKIINLPANSVLSKLGTYATGAGMNFTPPTTGDETTVLMRIEFVAADMNGNGDSLQANEGFFRVYQASAGKQAWLRGDYTSTIASATNCGDFHPVLNTSGTVYQGFFPASVHNTTWFKTLDSTYLRSAAGGSQTSTNANTNSNTEKAATIYTIMQHAGARCYLGGDPHLVAVERTAALYPTATDRNRGGEDTTFTPTGGNGAWKLYSATPDDTVKKYRPADAKYLFPLYRGLNPNTKGVIYFGGTVGVSGTLRGKVTMYAHGGTIVVLDDMRYADDPSRGICADILGMISDNNVVVADNALNTPQNVASSGTTWKSLGLTPDLYIHSVIMALNTSFTVENYDSGPNNALTCQASTDGHGCLYLTGGIIQQDRGPVGLSSGEGYIKRYSYDRCAAVNPPPYFPTTGRFTDNRYFELNPVGFNVTALFKSLTPAP